MANELTVQVYLRLDNAESDPLIINTGRSLVTVTGKGVIDQVQTVGTSAEAILLGDAGVGGFVFAQNLDATNFVEIRPSSTGTDTIRMKAGEFCLFRLSADATAPYAIADTGSCRVRFVVIQA